MKVRIRKKYPEGGNLSAYPHPKSFLNLVQRDYHIFQPQRNYTPGQNASSGRVSNAITDEIIMAMLPLPPVAKGIQAGVKGYRALKAAGKAEQIAAEVAAKQAEQEAKAAVSQLTTQTLKGRQPLITKRQLNAYDDPTRPHTSIRAAVDAMDRGSGVKDIWNAEDVIGKNRENTIRELITEELKNNPKSFVKDFGRADLANLPDDKIRNIINVNDEVRRHLTDTYYKETRQKLKGIDAYQQLTVNKHGGKIKKRNYTPTNMEGFHQANDAHLTSGPFLQRNGMSFQNGGKPTNVNYTDPQSFLTANGAYLDSLNYYNAARDFSSKFDALNPNHDEAGTNRKIEWLKTPEGQRLDSTMDAAAGRLFERNLPRGIYSPPMPTSPKTKPVFIPPNKRFPTGGYIPVAESTKVNKNINKNPAISAYIPTFQDALRSFNNKMLKDYGVKIKPGSLESVKEQREYFDQGDTSIHYVRTLKNAADTTELLQLELPHAIQLKHYGQNEMLRKSIIEHILYPSHDDTYDIKGTVENEAHYGAFKDSVDEKLKKHLSTLPYKFKGGGTIAPYITKDPNDPRIQTYNDSLRLYKDNSPSSGYTQKNILPISEKLRKDFTSKKGIAPVAWRTNENTNTGTGSPIYKKPTQQVILQIEQEMTKDTVRVPSTPPTKKLVQTKYMDARPYYQEEQMRDYDKTGKLDSAKIDAHKRWLKEQGTPNRDTNLLPVKHPYGGNISSLGQAQNGMNTAQLSQSADQGISMIPGFGQFYGLAKGAADTGRGMIKKDAYGVAKTNSGAVADSALTSTHQQAIDHFGRGETGAGIRSIFVNDAIVNAFDPSSINKRRHEGNRLQGIANTNGFQDSGFMANGGLLNIDPQGRVVTSRYDQGGNIRRIQGGVMHDEGYGIEHAYGASHEQGGMDYAPNAEIQGNEKVLDGEYVITDEPGSELDKTQMSISRRLDKNTKALSTRNNGDQMKLATDKLKNHAIQQNEEYLTARNNERDSKLRNAIRRAVKKYGGDLETLDAEMDQMRRGGAIASRGSKAIFDGGGTFDPLNDPLNRRFNSSLNLDPSLKRPDNLLENPVDRYFQTQELNTRNPGLSSGQNVRLNNLNVPFNNMQQKNDTPPTNRTGNNWANTAADLAPVIANTIAGLSKADKVQASKYYTKYMTPDLMKKDFEPIRRGIAGSQYGLRNSGMYSRAGQASIAAQGAKAMGDYSFNVDQANTGIKNQFKGLNSQIETGNRGIDWQSDMFNFQAKDARRNYLMQAAGDISKYSQNKQNYNRDQEFLEMAYPEYARIMRSKRG